MKKRIIERSLKLKLVQPQLIVAYSSVDLCHEVSRTVGRYDKPDPVSEARTLNSSKKSLHYVQNSLLDVPLFGLSTQSWVLLDNKQLFKFLANVAQGHAHHLQFLHFLFLSFDDLLSNQVRLEVYY